MNIFEHRPERFKAAVRAVCCDACNWPDCGCETTADILRKGIAAWEAFGSDWHAPLYADGKTPDRKAIDDAAAEQRAKITTIADGG